MSNICSGDHYSCGTTANLKIGDSQNGSINHIRNRTLSFTLGETPIIVNKVTRLFDLSFDGGWSQSYSSAVQNIDIAGNLQYDGCGGILSTNSTHSVSENYECITTILYFLDNRYNNAVGKEITEKITFSKSSDQMAGFKETWGPAWYPKFVITNHTLTTTTAYFIIIKGVKTVLKTVNSTTIINGPNNPLILVYPNPPSLAIPWINCDDIKTFGFYDYHAVGEGEGQEKIKLDGGDDFYFTDWMRQIGEQTRTADQQDATNRYFEYYLQEGVPPSQVYANPGVFSDDTPCCSIAVDPNGSVMYSALLGGEVFNFLTDGDLTTFDARITAGSKLFPIGLV